MIGDLPLIFRPMQASDMGYVLKTWSVDFHKVFPTSNVPNSIYFPHQKAIIEKILFSSTCTIACLDDEPDIIAGYIIIDSRNPNYNILHWGQVKGIYRREQIFTNLLTGSVTPKPLIVTHMFKLFKEFKKKFELIYDPYQLDRYK